MAKNLGEGMSHFTNDCEAIVMYTYSERYCGGDDKSYCIHIKGKGKTSWYDESQLELIETNKADLLEQWESEAKQEYDLKSDLDWIFKHGKDVLEGPVGATVAALAKCFGLTNLWGSKGEGATYWLNAMTTIEMAKPFLEAGDKEGWLNHCKTIEA